ncbi:hypothetical protein [Tomitella fengzijianii]|uniref:Uncharacterized protein n=1 Tax=Tomitella fengzijianii TaxID=2597660 RepID=A0A516X4E7_9ACTN|nr:hypothetical protein [Tomitella fengzijianii]QDQ97952.1 hypothetical protein FO059_12310 [Tomitella fengzijianii]
MNLTPDPARHVLHHPEQLNVYDLSGDTERAGRLRNNLVLDRWLARTFDTTLDGLPACYDAEIVGDPDNWPSTGDHARIEAAA